MVTRSCHGNGETYVNKIPTTIPGKQTQQNTLQNNKTCKFYVLCLYHCRFVIAVEM